MNLDQNQQRFVDACVKSSYPVVCMNTAGGGKTTVLVWSYKELLKYYAPRDIVVMCHNKHNQEDIVEKLPTGANVFTYSSICYRAVAKGYRVPKMQLNSNKYSDLIQEFAKQYWEDNSFTQEQWAEIEATEELRTFCMNTVTYPEDWPAVVSMAEQYGLAIPTSGFAQKCLPTVFDWGERGMKKPIRGCTYSLLECFDFTELLWWAATSERVQVPQYRVVMTDERQDCNNAHWIILKKTGGRQLSVGDPDQQLYSFMGSSLQGWEQLVKEPGTIVVDSPISYRCPSNVVNFAKQFCPRIESSPSAKKGAVNWLRHNQYLENLQPGEVVVTKRNASAIQIALDCIELGKEAMVKGKSIGNMLLGLLETLEKSHDFSLENLPEQIVSHRNQQVAILYKKFQNPQSQIQQVMDKCRGLQAMVSSFKKQKGNSVRGLRSFIQTKFSDDKRMDEITLASTTWKYKGFENPTVYLLEDDLASRKGEWLDWEVRQDNCASYVGCTRAMETLNIIETRESESNWEEEV